MEYNLVGKMLMEGLDVYLPLGSKVCVKMGQSTTGDQTVIAHLPEPSVQNA